MSDANPITLDKIDHPYYANEGCYYEAGKHYSLRSFDEFKEKYEDNDKDLNLLYRFDVKYGKVHCYFVMQRKAACYSLEFPYEPARDAEIRAFLEGYWAHMRALWTPFSGAEIALKADDA